ncbi:energy transducer TonB [Parvicella tangerina]|uniref:TonB C-terminal domain-containing protein n=1 Tax=Parvicella tangerina TaxID=2829795 RepID=A0A916NDL6_9FLAO|nr:energy transducer TonB [Parvicella tangerina]CAG5086935.1 hypothetical protein CRYO30217_03338 [Parvicella tangerina]
MDKKKSSKADLEQKRSSILLLGLVCATSLTLMSFEYTRFELNNSNDLMSSVSRDEPDWVMNDLEVYKPAAPVQQQEISHSAVVTPAPEINEIEEVENEETEESEFDFSSIPDVPEVFGQKEETTVLPPISPMSPVLPAADVMPEFPGGNEEMYRFIHQHIEYPEICRDLGIGGKTYVQFTVWKDGSIRDISVGEAKHKLLEKEAARIIEIMPKWIPGKVNGQDVSVRFALPVNFIVE